MAKKRSPAPNSDTKAASRGSQPPQRWLVPLLLAWLLPGGGHFYLKRWNHGALLLFSVAGMFVFGLLMRGRMFTPESGNLFNVVVTWGGYFSDMMTGALYFVATWLGYNQDYLPSPVADYGTKFLVCAGLLNVLAMVDAYEIAAGEKP